MKLLDQFVVVAQLRRLSVHTIECYLTWVRQFMTFCASLHGAWKHPAELRTGDAESFLSDLAIRRRLSASSQNQALCTLAFLYRHVLDGVIPNEHLGKFLLVRGDGEGFTCPSPEMSEDVRPAPLRSAGDGRGVWWGRGLRAGRARLLRASGT